MKLFFLICNYFASISDVFLVLILFQLCKSFHSTKYSGVSAAHLDMLFNKYFKYLLMIYQNELCWITFRPAGHVTIQSDKLY